MPDRAMLVAMVVGDTGLRILLAARLSLLRIELLTASRLDHLRRHGSDRMATLVLDERDMADVDGNWAEAFWLERRWRRTVVLTDQPVRRFIGPEWLLGIGRDSAEDALAERIEEWAALDRIGIA